MSKKTPSDWKRIHFKTPSGITETFTRKEWETHLQDAVKGGTVVWEDVNTMLDATQLRFVAIELLANLETSVRSIIKRRIPEHRKMVLLDKVLQPVEDWIDSIRARIEMSRENASEEEPDWRPFQAVLDMYAPRFQKFIDMTTVEQVADERGGMYQR